ncbi:MAG: hypothetical protein ABSF68_12365 [Candidatus Acidiferrales bacterium]
MKDEVTVMDCVQFREIYHDLDRPGTSGFRFRERALAHAETCAGCGVLLTDGEALDFAFRNLTQHNAGREAPPRIEAALLREFQASRLAGSRRRVHGQLAALGAAAAILLALGLGVQHRIASRPSTAAPQATNVAPAPAADASAKGLNPSASGLDEDVFAGKFVPVPYADDPAALEGGAIVRVTLPRSALRSFGLPVTESDGTDRVFADLLVSEDGTPQAIRLVSDANPNVYF